MSHILIQCLIDKTEVPPFSLLRKWATAALNKAKKTADITIRIVDLNEMSALNTTYRHKSGPTNVLSFPFETPTEIDFETAFLGDIVICAAVVNQEAEIQHKTRAAHWAHMIIHGIFHLLGYDHESDDEAAIMEALETEVMQSLGFNHPYDLIGENN